MTQSRVKLKFLEKSVLERWEAEAPNLANKLYDYYLTLEPIKDLLERKELERRAHKRYAISGNTAIQILRSSGHPESKLIKGDLCDISASGLSFIMNTSQKSAELLLGRQLSVKFNLRQFSPQLKIDQIGTIVGVHAQLFNEYLINVKWEQALHYDIEEKIRSMSPIK
jgi:hypothetical protein